MSARIDPQVAYRLQLLQEAHTLRSLGERLRAGEPDARERLVRFLHKLYGTAGTYGYEEVSSLAQGLRELVSEPDRPLPEAPLERLIVALFEASLGQRAAPQAAPIDLARALEMCGEDDRLRRQVAAELLRALPDQRAGLEAAVAAGDAGALARAAHKMGGGLAAVGAVPAAEVAAALEQAARRGDPGADELAERLTREIERVAAAIESSLRLEPAA